MNIGLTRFLDHMSTESTIKAQFGVSAIVSAVFLLFIGYISWSGSKFIESFDRRLETNEQSQRADHDQLIILKTQAESTKDQLNKMDGKLDMLLSAFQSQGVAPALNSKRGQ